MTKPFADSYITRRQAFAQAIEACEQLIRDYEAHRDPGGIVTGPDFNAQEIEAVKTAIVRIQCAEAVIPGHINGNASCGPEHATLKAKAQEWFNACDNGEIQAEDFVCLIATELQLDLPTATRSGESK